MNDQGALFPSHVRKSFMEKLGMVISFTTGYHPQASGHVEWTSQEIAEFLLSICVDQEDWAHFLPLGIELSEVLSHPANSLPVCLWLPTSLDPAVDKWFKWRKQVWETTQQNLLLTDNGQKFTSMNYESGFRPGTSRLIRLSTLVYIKSCSA